MSDIRNFKTSSLPFHQRPLFTPKGPTKSFYSVSQKYLEKLEDLSYSRKKQSDPNEVEVERQRVILIQRVLAENGQTDWEELYRLVLEYAWMDSCDAFDDWEYQKFVSFVQNRSFLFRSWDEFIGPRNCDYHLYFLIRYIAAFLYHDGGRMHVRKLTEKLKDFKFFGNRINEFIMDGFIKILEMNKNLFGLDKNAEMFFLTNEAKEIVSLWEDCSVDFIRQKTNNNGDSNFDKSCILNVFGVVPKAHKQRILVSIKEKRHEKDQKAYNVYLNPREVGMPEEVLKSLEPGTQLIMTAYRYESQRKYVLHKAITHLILLYPSFDSILRTNPLNCIEVAKKEEIMSTAEIYDLEMMYAEQRPEQLILDQLSRQQNLKVLVDSLIPQDVSITEKELSELIQTNSDAKRIGLQEIIVFLKQQPHLYKTTEDKDKTLYRKHPEETRGGLENLTKSLYEHSEIAVADMKFENEKFNQMLSLIEHAFSGAQEDAFIRSKYRFKDGFFLQI